MNLQQKINQLETKLRNNPQGVPYPELPTEEELIAHLVKLYEEKKAIWLKEKDTWYYILLRNGHEPPMNISKWVWQ